MTSKPTILLFLFTFLVNFVAVPTLSAKDRPNCKLSIHTKFKSGKKKLDILETYAYSRDECKLEARMRKLDSLENDEIEQVKVFFAFRGPAIIDIE